MNDEPRILVRREHDREGERACLLLKDYRDADELYASIRRLTPDATLRIDGFADMASLGASPNIETMDAYMHLLQEGTDPRALDVFVRAGHDPYDFATQYEGFFENKEEFARAWTQRYADVSPQIDPFVDYCDLGRHLQATGFFSSGGHYFSNH